MAIADIAFVCSKDKCPSGYTMLLNCPCGHPANLWKKFIGSPAEERYLCYSKDSKDDKIIEDMYIPGGSDRYVMKGYEVVKRTIEGEDSLNCKYLAIKRTNKNNAKNGVSDLAVYRCKAKPHASYKKLGAKLNSLYICAKIQPVDEITTAVTESHKEEIVDRRPSIPSDVPSNSNSNTSVSSYNVPPPTRNQPYNGPPPTGNHPYNVPPPTGNQPYNGPPPTHNQPYNGPPPTGNQPYNVPPPTGNQPYNIPPPTGNQPYNGPPPTHNQPYPPTHNQPSYNVPPPTYNYPTPSSRNIPLPTQRHSIDQSDQGGLLGFEHLDLDQPIEFDQQGVFEDDDEESPPDSPVVEHITIEHSTNTASAPSIAHPYQQSPTQPSGHNYSQPGPYSQPPGPYSQPPGPYSQPTGPYSQPTGPYSQPPGPYSQPPGHYSQPPGHYSQPTGPYSQPTGQFSYPPPGQPFYMQQYPPVQPRYPSNQQGYPQPYNHNTGPNQPRAPPRSGSNIGFNI